MRLTKAVSIPGDCLPIVKDPCNQDRPNSTQMNGALFSPEEAIFTSGKI